MKARINGEEVFKALKGQMIIGPSAEGYTLAYSADGENFTEYSQATPAGENCIVNGCPQYSYWKLSGNQSEVEIIL